MASQPSLNEEFRGPFFRMLVVFACFVADFPRRSMTPRSYWGWTDVDWVTCLKYPPMKLMLSKDCLVGRVMVSNLSTKDHLTTATTITTNNQQTQQNQQRTNNITETTTRLINQHRPANHFWTTAVKTPDAKCFMFETGFPVMGDDMQFKIPTINWAYPLAREPATLISARPCQAGTAANHVATQILYGRNPGIVRRAFGGWPG